MENGEEKEVEEVKENIEESTVNEVKNNIEEVTEQVEEQQNIENAEETVEEVVEENAEPEKKFNGYAIASLTCSLVGLIIFGMPLGLAAIITGINALKEFDEETQKHKWIAILGLVIGIIDVIFVSQYAINIYNQTIKNYRAFTQDL